MSKISPDSGQAATDFAEISPEAREILGTQMAQELNIALAQGQAAWQPSQATDAKIIAMAKMRNAAKPASAVGNSYWPSFAMASSLCVAVLLWIGSSEQAPLQPATPLAKNRLAIEPEAAAFAELSAPQELALAPQYEEPSAFSNREPSAISRQEPSAVSAKEHSDLSHQQASAPPNTDIALLARSRQPATAKVAPALAAEKVEKIQQRLQQQPQALAQTLQLAQQIEAVIQRGLGADSRKNNPTAGDAMSLSSDLLANPQAGEIASADAVRADVAGSSTEAKVKTMAKRTATGSTEGNLGMKTETRELLISAPDWLLAIMLDTPQRQQAWERAKP